MTANPGPTRRRVTLPTGGALPRVGKIRLGVGVPTGRTTDWGAAVVRPEKRDFFVVHADESGITSQDAADAFRQRYGDEPRQIDCMLAGQTPDDCMEGAWRTYGANKLKIRCDGVTMSKRTDTGGWAEDECQCARLGLADDDKKHCVLTYTVQLILPDVSGVGVWQLDTGSTISSRRMADFLQLLYNLRRDLRGVEIVLRLVAVKVQPQGSTQTVYVLDPQAPGVTPRQMITQATQRQQIGTGGPALPPLAADETSEPTLDRHNFEEAPAEPAEAPADPPNPAASTSTRAQSSAGDTDDDPIGAEGGRSNLDDVKRQIRELSQTDDGKAAIKSVAGLLGVRPTVNSIAPALVAKYGDEAADVNALIDQLEVAGDI